MKKRMLMSLLVLGSATIGFAASNTFKVSLLQDSTIDGKALKAGPYKLTLENGIATLTQGEESIEVPARMQTESRNSVLQLSHTEMAAR